MSALLQKVRAASGGATSLHAGSSRTSGFTLIELTVSIVIASILAGFTAMLVSAPVDAYLSQANRTVLNDSAEVISRTVGQDLRAALPNSVRIRTAGNHAIIEMLLVDTVTFYGTSSGTPDRDLDLHNPDTTFSAFGRLEPTTTATSYSYPSATPALYLVVNNRGTGLNDAYRLQEVITPTPVVIDVVRNASVYPTTGEETVTFSPSFHFTSGSPTNRMFLVSGPVTYICNSAAGTLRRYGGYAITASMPTSEASAQLNASGVQSTVLAANIASCNVSCRNGTNAIPCEETLVLEIAASLQTSSGNEVLRIMEQYPMDNRS